MELSKQNNHIEAEKCHRKALEIKTRNSNNPDIDTAVALSKNALGEELLILGRLDEAEKLLKESLATRATRSANLDAAVTRENLAQVYQAKGDLDSATRVRDQGVPNQLCCSHYNVCMGSLEILVASPLLTPGS